MNEGGDCADFVTVVHNGRRLCPITCLFDSANGEMYFRRWLRRNKEHVFFLEARGDLLTLLKLTGVVNCEVTSAMFIDMDDRARILIMFNERNPKRKATFPENVNWRTVSIEPTNKPNDKE
jgi:hypothetical protein